MLRSKRYYVRLRVPAALRQVLGRREVRCSLGTDNLAEALGRGTPILNYLRGAFAMLRRGVVTEETVVSICAKFSQHLLTVMSPGQRALQVSVMSPDQIDDYSRMCLRLSDLDQDAIRYGDYSHIEGALTRFAEKSGLEIDRGSENYPLLLQQALIARRDAFELKYQHSLGNYELTVAAPTTPVSVPVPVCPPPAVAPKTLTLSEACEFYITEKGVTEGAWDKDATLPQVKTTLKMFCTYLGAETPTASLTRAMLNDFKAKLALLPNQTLKAYAGKTVTELLAMEIPEDHRISKGTFANQLTWVKAFCDWAATNDYLAKCITKGLVPKRSTIDKHRRTACDAYTIPEVRTIFTSEHFTYNPDRLERFWGPLISAHTSGRLNEVGQLLVEDVCRIGGVLCFKMAIEEDEQQRVTKKKKLKSQASKRHIPVHWLLLELGFEAYVNELRAAGEVRLFPKLPAAKRGHGVELGKNYGRDITTKLFPNGRRRKVFNSFRHSVENQFKNLPDMRDSMQKYLTGHATGSLDFDHYGSDPEAANLKVFVDRIDYGLDIEGLKEKMANPVFVRKGPKPKRKAGATNEMPASSKTVRRRKNAGQK